jgi:hypothetical protein
MKIRGTFFLTGIFILIGTLFYGCQKQDKITIHPLSLDIQGKLGNYFEVVNDSFLFKVYNRESNGKRYYGHSAKIKIKRKNQDFSFNIDSLETEATYRTTLYFDLTNFQGDIFSNFSGYRSTIDDFKKLLHLENDSVMSVEFKGGCNYTKESIPKFPEGQDRFRTNSAIFYKE